MYIYEDIILANGFFCIFIFIFAGASYPLRCVHGTYSRNTGNEKLDDCTPCDWGQYCGEYNLTAPSGRDLRNETPCLHVMLFALMFYD